VRKKPRNPKAPTPAEVRARVEKAMREARFQNALELAKQLHKQEPCPQHLDLLKKAYLCRAHQLQEQLYNRDAISLLDAAQHLDPGNPVFLEQLAIELARSGAVRQALALLEKVPGAASAGLVLGLAADAAIQQETTGKALLPAEWQADFERIMLAFQQLEVGGAAKDEEARATLQGIGLRSPFLEWKLLLRGLQAYYLGDDVRALENWQRLSADRFPIRLAAPLRFQIDRTYRAAQPPTTQAALQQQFDRLHLSPLLQQLRTLRSGMASNDTLAPAFRQAETLLPMLRQQAPHLEKRLAACLYWALTQTGPDDILRYKRVFGAPADDPHFHRLEALAYEKGFQLDKAHTAWAKYEKDIAALADTWPADQAKRARALVWLRMGRNASKVPSAKVVKKLPRHLRDDPNRPRPLKPTAEECFRHSLGLVDDLLEAHVELFNQLRREEAFEQAIAVGRKLLELYPEHIETLQGLSGLLQEKGEPVEALALMQRALKANPLSRDLRGRVSYAHLACARYHAEEGRFEEARQQYQFALNLKDGQPQTGILCKWAACEFKAGDTSRAEELLVQARGESKSAASLAYQMLIEILRLKLDRKLKTRFDKEFKAGLASVPTGADVAETIDISLTHLAAGVTYTGQKTHVKQVLAFAAKVRTKVEFTEEQLVTVCRGLFGLNAPQKAFNDYIHMATRKFPASPHFPLLEVQGEMSRGGQYVNYFRVRTLLESARHLAEALPAGEQKEKLLKALDDQQRLATALDPYSSIFGGGIFDPFGFDDYEDDDDFDDDDDDNDYF
jgi:tetratricopeptide (TPR) repeat protein